MFLKRFRGFLAALMCLGLAFSLAACSVPAEDETVPNTDPAVVITTQSDAYTVAVDSMVEINATANIDTVKLSYASADETIATVNKYGKIIGVRPGTTEIIITADDGTTKRVSVTVEGLVYADVLRVALNVLYNDSTLGCTNTEFGPYVEIREDGQYTVTFNCTMDLSESSRKMGVKALENLTAIFLYDQAVRDGDQKASSVTSCNIRWDKITVNGQELTITNSEFKSAIKSSGIFDTNDPLNAWDGSAVEEVRVDTENHVLNINVDNPVTITVTFTIEGLTFAE